MHIQTLEYHQNHLVCHGSKGERRRSSSPTSSWNPFAQVVLNVDERRLEDWNLYSPNVAFKRSK